jgi:sugar phosphate isomerase/epimerase
MKFAICNEQYRGWDFERVCADAASCGYDGVELAPFTFDEDPRRIDERRAAAVGAAANAAGLEIVGLHWLLLRPQGLHLTTPDDLVRAQTVAFLQHLARLCAAAGGQVMVFGSPNQRDRAAGQSADDTFRRAVDACRQVAEVAGPLGVTLAMEPLGPKETNFMVYARDTVKLLDAVDHPACRLQLDVKAMSAEAEPVDQVIRSYASRMAHFHANDANLRGPGFGDTDFVPIAAALKDVGYDGWVSVEVFDAQIDPHETSTRSIEYLKRTFKEAGAI